MAQTSLRDSQDLEAFRARMGRADEMSAQVGSAAVSSAQADVGFIRSRVEYWRQTRAQRASDVERAEASLRSCASQENNCSAEAAALAAARRKLAEAEDALVRATTIYGRAQDVLQRLETVHRRFRMAMPARTREAGAELLSLMGRANDYSRTTDIGPGATAATVGSTALSGIGSTGLVSAPLERVDMSDSSVTGPESYLSLIHI